MGVRLAMRLMAGLALMLGLAGVAAAQEPFPEPIPLAYPEHYGGIPLSRRDTPPEQRAAEEADANAAEAACNTGDLAGCTRLGRAFLYGKGREQNRPVAELLLRQACDGAEAAGCFSLGVLLRSTGEPGPLALGAQALSRGCRLGDLEACAEEADVTESGVDGLGGDRAAAAALRRAACEKGAVSACRRIGSELVVSDDPAQRKEGLRLLERLCRAEDRDACSLVAGPLANEIPPRTALAREMLAIGCRSGAAYQCRELGDKVFADASGPPETRTAALALFDRACTLASHFCTLPEQIRARPALVTSCASGVQADCVRLGEIYGRDSTSPLHSPAEAAMLLGGACEAGIADACGPAARVLSDDPGPPTAEVWARIARLYEAGCALGVNADCQTLGELLLVETPLPPDRPRGYALLTLACERGDERSCESFEEKVRFDPDAPVAVADLRHSPPLTEAEQAEQDRREAEEEERERRARREQTCRSSEVAFRGAVFADTICMSVVRVIKGFRVKPGGAPWQALLWRPERMAGRNLSAADRVECGGALIREGWILTAAHCVVDKDKRPLIGAGHRIRLGVYNPRANEGISYPIMRAIAHPTYHEKSRAFDIALIQFDPRSGADSGATGPIARITLDPKPLGQRDIRGGMEVYTFGWGREAVNGQSSDHLKGAKMQIEDPVACATRTKFRGDLLQDALLCASAADRSQACNGDSGGPLVTYGDGRPTVIGVVSAGEECGATGVPSRYTRVAKVRDWIADVLAGVPPERRRR